MWRRCLYLRVQQSGGRTQRHAVGAKVRVFVRNPDELANERAELARLLNKAGTCFLHDMSLSTASGFELLAWAFSFLTGQFLHPDNFIRWYFRFGGYFLHPVISVRVIVLAVLHNSGDTVSLISEWSKVKFRLVRWRKTSPVRWCNFYSQRALLLCHIYSDFSSYAYTVTLNVALAKRGPCKHVLPDRTLQIIIAGHRHRGN